MPPEKTFTCPKCGGHFWGSIQRISDGTFLRFCNSRPGCKFSWAEEDDDKYLVPAQPGA